MHFGFPLPVEQGSVTNVLIAVFSPVLQLPGIFLVDAAVGEKHIGVFAVPGAETCGVV